MAILKKHSNNEQNNLKQIMIKKYVKLGQNKIAM